MNSSITTTSKKTLGFSPLTREGLKTSSLSRVIVGRKIPSRNLKFQMISEIDRFASIKIPKSYWGRNRVVKRSEMLMHFFRDRRILTKIRMWKVIRLTDKLWKQLIRSLSVICSQYDSGPRPSFSGGRRKSKKWISKALKHRADMRAIAELERARQRAEEALRRSEFQRQMERDEIDRRRNAEYSTSSSGLPSTRQGTEMDIPPPPPPPAPRYGVASPNFDSETGLWKTGIIHRGESVGGVQVHEFVPVDGEPFVVARSRLRTANRRRKLMGLDPLPESLLEGFKDM